MREESVHVLIKANQQIDYKINIQYLRRFSNFVVVVIANPHIGNMPLFTGSNLHVYWNSGANMLRELRRKSAKNHTNKYKHSILSMCISDDAHAILSPLPLPLINSYHIDPMLVMYSTFTSTVSSE